MMSIAVPEIFPQITYNEGLLQIRAGYHDDSAIEHDPYYIKQRNLRRRAALDYFDGERSTAYIDDEYGFRLRIDLEPNLGKYFRLGGDLVVGQFLARLKDVLPLKPDDDRDRVIGVDWLSSKTSIIVVNEQFQRWLNAQGFDETVARRTTVAMALPFGKAAVQAAQNKFKYFERRDYQEALGDHTRAIVEVQDFSVTGTNQEITDNQPESRMVSWRTPRLVHDISRLTVSDNERLSVELDPGTKRLYELHTDGVYRARKMLGFLLGIATMAYSAAQYKGREVLS